MAMHSVYPVIVSEKSTAVQKKVQVNADKLAVCLIGKRDLQVGPSAHPEAAEPEPGAKAGCTAARHAPKPPLCKGRWLGFRGPGEAQRQRVRWGEEEQRSDCAFRPQGGNKGCGACDDEVEGLMLGSILLLCTSRLISSPQSGTALQIQRPPGAPSFFS